MELLELLIILVIAIVISAVLYFGFGRRGPYRSYWSFLLLLFLSGIAGRLWIIPAGPEMGGYAWMPLLFWISLIAFLLAATSPAKGTRVKGSDDDDGGDDLPIDPARAEIGRRVAEQEITPEGAAAALGVFFWIFLFLLLIAILTGSIM